MPRPSPEATSMLCSRRMDQPFSHLGGFGFVWHWGHQINDSEEIGCGKTPGIRQWGRREGWPRDEKNIPKVGTLKGLGSAAPIQPLQPHEFFGKRHNGRLGCVSQTIEFLLDIIPGHLSLLSMSLSPRPTLAPAWNSNFSIILAGFSGNSPAAASGDGGIQQRSSPEPPVQEVLDGPTFPAGAGGIRVRFLGTDLGGLSRLFLVGSELSWMQGKAEGRWEGEWRQRRGREMRKSRRESAAGVGEALGGAGAAGANLGRKSVSRVGLAAHPPFPAHCQLCSHLEPPNSVISGGGKAPTQPGNRNSLLLPTPRSSRQNPHPTLPGPRFSSPAPFEAIPRFPGAPRN